MGKPTGFREYARKSIMERDPGERVKDFNEFHQEIYETERKEQASRCMDCGIPFCQSSFGCPVYNKIPEWNDLIYHGQWKDAFDRLMETNNFPEYTGRVCPAPCETACTLGITDPAVTIKDIECAIIDKAYEEGYMQPRIPEKRTGKKVAVVGSGPAGLAAADQLNQAGHSVTVFEKDDRIGGLLMYGIPNMKLDKEIVERRNRMMAEEGIVFKPGVHVGVDIEAGKLHDEFDAVLLAIGCTKPRDLPVPGRELKGVHFAMEFLTANTKSFLDSHHTDQKYISAEGKSVVVIGGGYTGSDCIGTSMRHGCKQVANFELVPKPETVRTDEHPWPTNPPNLRYIEEDYGHKEANARFGKDPRVFSILTKEFVGNEKGEVKAVKTVNVEWTKEKGKPPRFDEIPGTEREWEADLVMLSMGFLGPGHEIIEQMELKTDSRSNIYAPYDKFNTSIEGVFSAGDSRRGASQVVWAINEGRGAAREIDRFLMGTTQLP